MTILGAARVSIYVTHPLFTPPFLFNKTYTIQANWLTV